jgi:tRNA uridine 5-carboxymethylaminomethyl modification enzyme
MLKEMQAQPNLTLREGSVEDLILEGDIVRGVKLADGTEIRSKTVVLTTGTFLSGLIHIGMSQIHVVRCAGFSLSRPGDERIPAGRIGDAASTGLSGTLRKAKFVVDRLKTGTPPRLDCATINFTNLQVQPGDEKPTPFSYMHTREDLIQKQVPCHLTWTTPHTTRVITEHMHMLPKFESGEGKPGGQGPRYCPSIEVKAMRFPDRNHHIWLEPEGLNSNVIYPAGISVSLPRPVQDRFIKTIPGLENVNILQYGSLFFIIVLVGQV